MTTSRSPALGFIFVTVLLDIAGIGLLIPVSPTLVASFVGNDPSMASRYVGPLIATFTLAQFTFAPALGALSDRFGRRPLLLAATALAAVSYTLSAIAPALGWLFVARVLSGVGAAGMSVATAYVADVSAPEERARNFGLVGAAFALGFTLGPALGGALASLGLRVPFWTAAALATANFVYGLVVLPESRPADRNARFDARRLNPFSFVATLRRHALVAALAVTMVLAGLAQQCQQSTWVLYTALRYGWGPLENGASLAVAGLCGVAVQAGLVPRWLPRLGPVRAIGAGIAAYAVSLVLFGLAPTGAWFMLVILASSPAGLLGPAVQTLMASQVGADEQGALQGALTSLTSLTGIVGPLFATTLFAATTAPTALVRVPGMALYAGAALLALAGLAFVHGLSRATARGTLALE